MRILPVSALVLSLIIHLTRTSLNIDLSADECPTHTSKCPSSGVANNGSLCCPYVGGTCCKELDVCCPPGEACHMDANKSDEGEHRVICISSNYRPWRLPMTPILKMHSSIPLRSARSLIESDRMQCGESTMSCYDSSSTTCCPSTYIGYDCCPINQGVCCDDFLNCCPANTICDLQKGGCIKQPISLDKKNINKSKLIPFYRKLKAIKNYAKTIAADEIFVVKKIDDVSDLNNIKCLDNVTICYDSDTCCPTGGGSFGCCPIPNAVCCQDYKNCCPSGMRCDPITGSCIRQNGEPFRGLPLLSSIASKPSSLVYSQPAGVAERSNANMKNFYYSLKKQSVQHAQQDANSEVPVNLICPGGEYSCPDGMTCCPANENLHQETKYNCCPMSNAVCCIDKIHCCPHGTKCDLTHDVCTSAEGNFTLQFVYKLSSKKVIPEIPKNMTKQYCPDHSSCPDTYTCCQLPSGSYGCCPYFQATCCDDHVHCCPRGTVCDTKARGCRQFYLDFCLHGSDFAVCLTRKNCCLMNTALPGNDVNVYPFGQITKNAGPHLKSSVKDMR